MSKRLVMVASKNPIKEKATRDSYAEVFQLHDGPVEVRGVDAPSGVSHQPLNEHETYRGALNRIRYVQRKYPDADYWVAIEGGVILLPGSVEEIGCILVAHKNSDRIFKVEAMRFEVPTETARLLRQGFEMGPANDQIFGMSNSKQSGGMLGIITDQLVVRYQLYFPPLVIAFSQIKNQNKLYPERV